MNKSIQGDFQICISVPLTKLKKKKNCFIYIVLAEHCSQVIKLGEFKRDQKCFVSQIRKSWKTRNRNNHSSQLMCPCLVRICWGLSTGCFICSFVIEVISEKALCNKGFTNNLRDIFTINYNETIIPTDFVTNSFLSSFFPFLQIKNKNHVFSNLVVW